MLFKKIFKVKTESKSKKKPIKTKKSEKKKEFKKFKKILKEKNQLTSIKKPFIFILGKVVFKI